MATLTLTTKTIVVNIISTVATKTLQGHLKVILHHIPMTGFTASFFMRIF